MDGEACVIYDNCFDVGRLYAFDVFALTAIVYNIVGALMCTQLHYLSLKVASCMTAMYAVMKYSWCLVQMDESVASRGLMQIYEVW